MIVVWWLDFCGLLILMGIFLDEDRMILRLARQSSLILSCFYNDWFVGVLRLGWGLIYISTFNYLKLDCLIYIPNFLFAHGVDAFGLRRDEFDYLRPHSLQIVRFDYRLELDDILCVLFYGVRKNRNGLRLLLLM